MEKIVYWCEDCHNVLMSTSEPGRCPFCDSAFKEIGMIEEYE